MNVNRIIKVRGNNAVKTLREFLAAWWLLIKPDALLAPVELPDGAAVTSKVITDPRELALVNPFAPVMLANAASAFDDFVHNHPNRRLVAMMRPCELRTLVELRKRRSVSSEPVVIVGVDCLGTLPPAQYAECVQKRGPTETTRNALAYAAEGGFSPQRLRPACQICDWPAPREADVTIGAIGVSPDQYLLVIARDEATASRLRLTEATDETAVEAQVARREVAVGAVAEMRAEARANLFEAANHALHFSDVGSALAWFANCSLCGDCLDACPLYNGELTTFLGVRGTRFGGRAPLAEVVAVSRWLASCAGCGMCEEACTGNVPLMLLISALSHRIRDELHYRPGDPVQKLPWVKS